MIEMVKCPQDDSFYRKCAKLTGLAARIACRYSGERVLSFLPAWTQRATYRLRSSRPRSYLLMLILPRLQRLPYFYYPMK